MEISRRIVLLRSSVFMVVAFALLLLGISVQAGTVSPVVIGPANILAYPAGPGGWYGYVTRGNGNTSPETSTGRYNFVYGPGTPPLGTGSLRLRTGSGTGGSGVSGNGGRVFFPNRDLDGVLLSSITSFSYSTYISARNSGTVVAPGINLYVDLDGSGTYSNAVDALLVYEPTYTGTTLTSTWQTWNLIGNPSAVWWDVRGNATPATPPTGSLTLAAIATAFPNARVFPFGGGAGTIFVVGSSGGTPFDNFDGNIDNVVINTRTYNFEPASTVYIDGNWSAVPDLAADTVITTWAYSPRFGTGTFVATAGCPTTPTTFLQDGFESIAQAETELGASPVPGTVVNCTAEYASTPAIASTLNIGSSPVGTPISATPLTLNSTGAAQLSITGISVTGTNASDFSVTAPATFPVNLNGTSSPPAGSQTVTIQCTPSAAGLRTATLEVAHNGSNVASPATYTLECTGTQIAGYASTPIPGAVPLVTNTTTPTSQMVTISETGNADLTISAITVTGDSAITLGTLPTLPITIVDGSGTTLTFNIACASTTPATYTATVTVTHNAPGSPATYNVSCIVSATPIPGYSSTPAPGAIALGAVAGTPNMQMVTISEIGTAALTINSIGITGNPELTLTNLPALPTSIADGSGATVVFDITCNSATPGTYTGTVTVAHNAPGSPAIYNVTCTVTAAPTAVFSASLPPGPLPLNPVVPGAAQTTVTISNPGTAPLVITSGIYSGEPEIVFTPAFPAGATIPPGGTPVSFTVACTSATPGTYTGTITLVHNGPGSPAVYNVTCTASATPVVTPIVTPVVIAPPVQQCLVIPVGSVVGRLSQTAQIYYEPGNASPGLFLPGGTAYWIVGIDATGEFYKVVLACQFVWVEADLMGPNFDSPWFGRPLPTNVVQ